MIALLKANKLSVVRYNNSIKNIVAQGLTKIKGISKNESSTSDYPKDLCIDAIIGISTFVNKLSINISKGMMITAIASEAILMILDVL